MIDLAPEIFGALLVAAFAAGLLDAVGGGGGLIQLPALLMALPASNPAAAMATNKLSSILGTSVAARTYARHVDIPRAIAAPMMMSAFAGSALGSWAATRLDSSVFRPAVFVVLIGLWIYMWRNPTAALREVDEHTPRFSSAWAACAVGGSIGFYDGLIGPGTGAFLIVSLVGLFGFSFLKSSAVAKFVNVATNAASLMVFIAAGYVVWALGLAMGACNMAGGYVGSRLAVAFGSGFVRQVLLVAVGVLIVRFGWSIWG